MSGGSDDSCATLTCAVSRCKAYDGRRVRDTTGDPGTAERHVIEEFTVRYRSYTAKAKAIGYLKHKGIGSRVRGRRRQSTEMTPKASTVRRVCRKVTLLSRRPSHQTSRRVPVGRRCVVVPKGGIHGSMIAVPPSVFAEGAWRANVTIAVKVQARLRL